MNKEFYYSPTTLNIFSDASVVHRDDGETIACPGAIAVANNEYGNQYPLEEKFDCLRYSTNNRGELTAILLALQLANKYKNTFTDINIFSDSKISVLGLRDWLSGWIRNTVGGIMISSSGQPVMNQDIIKRIIMYVINNNIRFRLYHCKGHVNQSGLDNASKVFKESNGIILNPDLVRAVARYNDEVDVKTGIVLDRFKAIPMEQPMFPIDYAPITHDLYLSFKALLVNSNKR